MSSAKCKENGSAYELETTAVEMDEPDTLWSSAHFCLNCSSDVKKSSSSHASSLSFPASGSQAGQHSLKTPRDGKRPAPFFFLIALVSDLAAFFSCFSFFAALACKRVSTSGVE